MTNDLFFTYSIIASAAQLRMNPDMGRFEFTRGLFKKKHLFSIWNFKLKWTSRAHSTLIFLGNINWKIKISFLFLLFFLFLDRSRAL
jgi:uncharacterized protein YdgA (DUF945 family)